MSETIQEKDHLEEQTGISLPEIDTNKQTSFNNDLKRFTGKKKHKKTKWVIAILLLAVVGFGVMKFTMRKDPSIPVSTVPLEKGDLTNIVSLTGVLESANSRQVYAKGAGNIDTVAVSVGDHVEAGDVLCLLDSSDIKLSIEEKNAYIANTKKSNQLNLSSAQKNYEDAVNDLKNQLDSSVEAAEHSLEQAQRRLNDARSDLNDHKDDLEIADDVMYASEKKLSRARDAMEKAKKALHEAEKSGVDVEKYKQEYDEAEKAYSEAFKEWNDNNTEYGGDLSVYSKDYRSARESYEQALTNRDIAIKESKRKLEDLQDSIEKSELTADQSADQFALQRLHRQLADATVTAPVSGTVTVVNAEVGSPASGLLFVIEDTNNLVVKTKIKEYDVPAIQEGMAAEVKSDATGEAVFEGSVQKIFPAAMKTADGSVKEEGSAEFETHVAITSEHTGLRVGMNVRLGVITGQRKDVYSVPYDAVTTNAEGQDIIYIAKLQEDGTMMPEEIPVTTGMETDFSLEVSGDQLTDGMQIITDPSMIIPGMQISVLSDGMMPLAEG
mgnify:FL=1